MAISRAQMRQQIEKPGRSKKKNGKIVLYNASDYLENLFKVTKLNLVFSICKDEESAIKAIK